jgi:bifunctional non-homologous end joining protein LigD
MTIRFPVAPMKAVIGVLPPESEDERWAYEIKWDGYRSIVFVDVADRSVRVQSSSGRDVTARFPELGRLWSGVNATSVVLDGELVAIDDTGRPSFEALQAHRRDAVLHAFDVLALDGHDVTGLAYEQRRALLAQALEPGSNWIVPAHRIGDGAALLDATGASGLEGIMAKRLGSTYVPGTRSPAWRKVKHRRPVDVVIGGRSAGAGARSSTFGSLLVGRIEEGRLRFVGGVGTGFTQRRLEELTTRLAGLATDHCPFDPPPPRDVQRTARWVRPELTARIEIAEFTNDGLIRHPSFIDLVERP